MSAWTRSRKLDALMEVIAEHVPLYYLDDDGGSTGDVYRCSCGDAGIHSSHLREMIDNEGFIQDDPGVR